MGKFNLSQLMNDASKSDAEPDKNGFKVEMIPVEKVVPSDMNKYTVANVEELKASIEMMGLQQNLLVRERADGTYEIISGHRRFKAMKELYSEGNADFETVPCKIIKSVDDITTELQLLFGNSTIRQMSDWERTYQAQRIKELLTELKKSGYKFQGRMRQIVADILNVSPAQVGRMESINENLIPEFQEEFKAGNIGPTAAYQFSRLPQKQQAQEMAEFKESGAAKVKDIEEKRESIKPRAEPAVPEESVPKQTETPALLQSEAQEKSNSTVQQPDNEQPPKQDAPKADENQMLINLWANNVKRCKFVHSYKDWGVWFKVPQLDATFYKYDLPDGVKIIVLEYLAKTYYPMSGEPDYHIAEIFYLQKFEHFTPYHASEAEIAGYLMELKKKLQKGSNNEKHIT